MNNMIEKKRPKNIREKKLKPIYECQICGRQCHYKFYGVWSCGGCKNFFLRAVIRSELYKCVMGGSSLCVNRNIDEIYCRACRMDKCLLVGMNLVSFREGIVQKTFIEILEKRRLDLLLNRQNYFQANLQMAVDDLPLFENFIKSMGPIERAFRRIWDSDEPLPVAFLKRHNGIQELLVDGDNLLGKADQFKLPNKYWNKVSYLYELEMLGIFCPTTMNIMIKDSLLCVELVKTMPHFLALQMEDKMNVLKNIFVPLSTFISAYYSNEIGAKAITKANGFAMICSQELNKFASDPKIRSIAEINDCKFVERINLSGIGYDEFLLLIAIFVANSTVDNLTLAGREHLYNASVHYANILQKYLQKKFGLFEGMQKFATAIRLIEWAYKAKQMFERFSLYYEVFYERRDLAQLLPNSLKFCFTT